MTLREAATSLGRMEGPPRSAPSDGLYRWLMGLGLLLALVPLWWSRLIPSLDGPSHLGAVAAWHHFGDPSWRISEFYELHIYPAPYFGFYLPVHLLAYVFPIEIAGKLVLSGYAVALPLCFAQLLARFGRSRYFALFALPFVYNTIFLYGFFGFCIGVPIVFAALVAEDDVLTNPTWQNAVKLMTLCFVLYFCHVLVWIYFGLLATTGLFWRGWRPRACATAAAAMLPSALFALISARLWPSGLVTSSYKARYPSWKEIAQTFPSEAISAFTQNGRPIFLILFFLLFLAIVVTLYVNRERETILERPAPAPNWGYATVCALSWTIAIFGPTRTYAPVDIWIIGTRVLPWAVLFMFGLSRRPIVGKTRWLFVPVLGMAAFFFVRLTVSWARFNARALPGIELIETLPRGSQVLTLIVGGEEPEVDSHAHPYQMINGYAQILLGGFHPYGFLSQFPIKRRAGSTPAYPHMWRPDHFNFAQHARGYDFVLTKDERSDYALARPQGSVTLIEKRGIWRLYRIAK